MNPDSHPRGKTGPSAKDRSGTRDAVVYAHIFDAILEQRLAPATRLSEEALGAIFAVSRTAIRRAPSRLGQGVVLLQPNRGALMNTLRQPSLQRRPSWQAAPTTWRRDRRLSRGGAASGRRRRFPSPRGRRPG